MKFSAYALIFISLFCGQSVFAKGLKDGPFVNPSLFYSKESLDYRTTSTQSKGSDSATYLNANVGYGLANGFAFGVKYYDETHDYSDNSNNDENVHVTALGPLIGYAIDQFRITACAFVLDDPKRTEKTTSKVKYSEGSGTIYDAAYLFDLGSVAVGPQLSLINLSYTRREVNGTDDTTFKSRHDSRILPSVSLNLSF